MDYILSPEADKDIEEIASYTFENWGEQQTADYLDDLKNAFENIISTPHLGRERKEIKVGIYSRFHQQHTIFYQYNKNKLLVVLRVLHQSRDIQRAFK